MSIVFIGLGSNMQQPRQQLMSAKKALEAHHDLNVLQCSSFYQSKAMTLASSEVQNDYINAVIKLQTTQTPQQLLDCLQTIENQQGRERLVLWGARTLDLDILLFDQLNIKTEHLTVPHPGLAERNFVLYPLLQIEPELNVPGLGKVALLANKVSTLGIQKSGEFE